MKIKELERILTKAVKNGQGDLNIYISPPVSFTIYELKEVEFKNKQGLIIGVKQI